MNKLALYCRASKEDDGADESVTIQNQRDLLRHFVKERGEFSHWVQVEFQDDGWTGTTFDRPGIQQLLKLAGTEIQCIIVKDFSRFGRNLVEVGNYLDQIFPLLGVRFISVNEGYDSKDFLGRTVGLEVSLKAMVYEMYSRDLSKKISSVKEGQMEKGRYTGSFSFYGYQKSATASSGLEIDPKAAKIVQYIFSLATKGTKVTQIAQILNQERVLPPLSYHKQNHLDEKFHSPKATESNLWTRQRVAAILRDERYTGVLISKKRQRITIAANQKVSVDPSQWIRAEHALNPIISKEEFEKAQALFQSRAKRRPMPSANLFRGLLKCGQCGRALEAVPTKNVGYRCPVGKLLLDSPCVQIHIQQKELEEIILAILNCQIALLQKENWHDEPETPVNPDVQKLSDKIRKCKLEQSLLFEQFARGLIGREGYARKKKELFVRLSDLQVERENLLHQLEHPKPPAQSVMQNVFAQSLSRELLTAFVQEIRVQPDQRIEVIWNFRNTQMTAR